MGEAGVRINWPSLLARQYLSCTCYIHIIDACLTKRSRKPPNNRAPAKKMRIITNLALFQLGWLAAVLGGAHQLPWLGVAAVLGVITVHLQLAGRPVHELKLVGIAALIGFIWDSLLVALGWLTYPSGILLAGTAPYWIVAMWMNFATTLNVSLRWLRRRWLAPVLLGGIGGPLAYYTASKLGGVFFTEPVLALGALAIGWALLTPLLVIASERFDGFAPVLLPLNRQTERHVHV